MEDRIRGVYCEPREYEESCCVEAPVSNNKALEINISPVDYGYVVRVGCQTFVFEELMTMMDNLTKYLEMPNDTQTEWMTNGNLPIL